MCWSSHIPLVLLATTFLLHVAFINKLCMQMDNPVSLNLYILQSEFSMSIRLIVLLRIRVLSWLRQVMVIKNLLCLIITIYTQGKGLKVDNGVFILAISACLPTIAEHVIAMAVIE